MSGVEILVLIAGIVIFILSFVIPEKKTHSKEEIRLGEELIKELVEKELQTVQKKVDSEVDDAMEYQLEKTERAMERLTNEKIMAVSEYSDTVLSEIHKNHEEVIFLYDMMNDKRVQLKQAVQEAQEAATKLEDAGRQAVEIQSKIEPKPVAAVQEDVQEQAVQEFSPLTMETIEVVKPERKKKKPVATKKTESSKVNDKELPLQDFEGEGKTNNDKILALHNAGKSNMAIAKELGLGMGEVKLVIDLFKGGAR